jgi:hypothetical protein
MFCEKNTGVRPQKMDGLQISELYTEQIKKEDKERKLWTYEENRRFLEAVQKFGQDYRRI